MCEHGNDTEMPYWIRKNCCENEWKPLIVDSCMAEAIQFLHNLGIRTFGCCCGHGTTGYGPEILANLEDLQRIMPI